MRQRINPKLAVAWYPKDWWRSDFFMEHKHNHTMIVGYHTVLWSLYLEGGRAKITEETLKTFAGWSDYQCKKLFVKLSQNFEVGVDQKWSTKSVTKRIQKAESFSESNKKKAAGRHQRDNFSKSFTLKVDHNPKKGDGAEKEPIPPLKKMNEETELPEWAKEQS